MIFIFLSSLLSIFPELIKYIQLLLLFVFKISRKHQIVQLDIGGGIIFAQKNILLYCLQSAYHQIISVNNCSINI